MTPRLQLWLCKIIFFGFNPICYRRPPWCCTHPWHWQEMQGYQLMSQLEIIKSTQTTNIRSDLVLLRCCQFRNLIHSASLKHRLFKYGRDYFWLLEIIIHPYSAFVILLGYKHIINPNPFNPVHHQDALLLCLCVLHCAQLCWPMRWLVSLSKLSSVKLRPHPYWESMDPRGVDENRVKEAVIQINLTKTDVL